MYIYFALRDDGYGDYQLIGAFSSVALAKRACECCDENIDTDKWWLDKPTIELWRNGDYLIDRSLLDDPDMLTDNTEAAQS